MKKIKLFLSLCMMCLSVAVLCMGILAASSATYNINGNISYNMIDGIALVNTRVYKVAEQKTTAELQTAIDGTGLSSMTFETIEQTSGYILSQKLDTKATLSENATQSEISAGSINISFGATDSSVWYYTYYIVINISNLSSEKALSATLTDNTTYTSVNYYTNTSQTSIAKGETKNIVIGLSLSDTTVDSLNIDINDCSLTIETVQTITFSIEYYDEATGTYTFTTTFGITWEEFIETLPRVSESSKGRYINQADGKYIYLETYAQSVYLSTSRGWGYLYDAISSVYVMKTFQILAHEYRVQIVS